MTTFLETFNHWGWWIFALVLFGIELLAPGVFFLWLGLAAVVVGFIAFVLPDLGWQMDFIIFADLKEIDESMKVISACCLVVFGLGTLCLIGLVVIATRWKIEIPPPDADHKPTKPE